MDQTFYIPESCPMDDDLEQPEYFQQSCPIEEEWTQGPPDDQEEPSPAYSPSMKTSSTEEVKPEKEGLSCAENQETSDAVEKKTPEDETGSDDENKENVPPLTQCENVTETLDADRSPELICLPSTPRPKRTRSRFQCECNTMNVEYKRNVRSLVESIEAEHNVNIQSKRKRLSEPERWLSSEFVIGKGLVVRIVVLSDLLMEPGKRVVLSISSERNQINLNALSFFKTCNALHRIFANYNTQEDDESENEISLCEGSAYVEIINDEEGLWMLFRQYVGDWVSDRIYMSSRTWLDFRSLFPLLINCVDVYIATLLLQDSMCVRALHL
ncbi:hypothetical protein B566_EDAN011522 [Ephemera danica]|nr:hypothetical protein B566_EDAN011522 [Ephemera danica]